MRPRNKRQLFVCELSEQLPYIADRVHPWAFENCITHRGFRTKKATNCLSCGHTWTTTSMRTKNETCPACRRKLTIETTRKQKHIDWARFAVMDVEEDIQIIRYFNINCHFRTGQEPTCYSRELMQHYLFPDGKCEVISRTVGGMGMSYDHFGGDLSLKDTKGTFWKYNIAVYKIHPEMSLLPVYLRNGFTSAVTDIRPFDVLSSLPNDSKAETLLKTKQFELLRAKFFDRENAIYRYWSSIKICIRSKYLVKDAITWLDYLDLLAFFHKDLRNSVYVCPRNLKKEHDRLVKKKREIEKKKKVEKLRQEINEAQARYEKSKGLYFGLEFKEGDLTVKVLEHVREFLEEGDMHRHCVFTNKYFDKEDSLVLSAKINGLQVETVEVSLTSMKVIQSRGTYNKATDHHDRIVSLVRKRMNEIRKRYKPVMEEVA